MVQVTKVESADDDRKESKDGTSGKSHITSGNENGSRGVQVGEESVIFTESQPVKIESKKNVVMKIGILQAELNVGRHFEMKKLGK